MVEPPQTTPCRLSSSRSKVVGRGLVCSNHPEHTRNFSVGQLSHAAKWFEKVCHPKLRPVGLLHPTLQWFVEVPCGRTTLNTAL